MEKQNQTIAEYLKNNQDDTEMQYRVRDYILTHFVKNCKISDPVFDWQLALDYSLRHTYNLTIERFNYLSRWAE